jgi:hypothetical protein
MIWIEWFIVVAWTTSVAYWIGEYRGRHRADRVVEALSAKIIRMRQVVTRTKQAGATVVAMIASFEKAQALPDYCALCGAIRWQSFGGEYKGVWLLDVGRRMRVSPRCPTARNGRHEVSEGLEAQAPGVTASKALRQ